MFFKDKVNNKLKNIIISITTGQPARQELTDVLSFFNSTIETFTNDLQTQNQQFQSIQQQDQYIPINSELQGYELSNEDKQAQMSVNISTYLEDGSQFFDTNAAQREALTAQYSENTNIGEIIHTLQNKIDTVQINNKKLEKLQNYRDKINYYSSIISNLQNIQHYKRDRQFFQYRTRFTKEKLKSALEKSVELIKKQWIKKFPSRPLKLTVENEDGYIDYENPQVSGFFERDDCLFPQFDNNQYSDFLASQQFDSEQFKYSEQILNNVNNKLDALETELYQKILSLGFQKEIMHLLTRIGQIKTRIEKNKQMNDRILQGTKKNSNKTSFILGVQKYEMLYEGQSDPNFKILIDDEGRLVIFEHDNKNKIYFAFTEDGGQTRKVEVYDIQSDKFVKSDGGE